MPEDPGVMPEDPEVMPEDPEVMPEDPEVTPEVMPEVSGSLRKHKPGRHVLLGIF